MASHVLLLPEQREMDARHAVFGSGSAAFVSVMTGRVDGVSILSDRYAGDRL